MALELHISRPAIGIVISCSGRIVFGPETTVLCKTVRDVLIEDPRIVLDLAEVRNVDSGGLGALVGLVLSARRVGGDVKCCKLSPKLKNLLHITRLDAVIEIWSDEASAIAAFRRRAVA